MDATRAKEFGVIDRVSTYLHSVNGFSSSVYVLQHALLTKPMLELFPDSLAWSGKGYGRCCFSR